jgi:Family of unknown function (DUF6338)
MLKHSIPDIASLAASLLPGFVVAFFLYTLIAHKKPSTAERFFLATLFSLFVKFCVNYEKKLLEWLGQRFNFGEWSWESELGWAVISAIALSLLFAKLVNIEAFHSLSRKFGITTKVGDPSNWHWAFRVKSDYVVLHFKDGRRLLGYPEAWPDQQDKGHFYMFRPRWIHGKGEEEDPSIDGILISAKSVAHIEFLKPPLEQVHEQPQKT